MFNRHVLSLCAAKAPRRMLLDRLPWFSRRSNCDAAISRRYLPCGSCWLEIPSEGKFLNLGVTQSLYDKEIAGDIDKVTLSSSALTLHWSGLKISDADELYHTVWQNVEGVKDIDVRVLPFLSSDECKVEVNPRIPEYHNCEEDWVLRISAANMDKVKLLDSQSLISEEEYLRLNHQE